MRKIVYLTTEEPVSARHVLRAVSPLRVLRESGAAEVRMCTMGGSDDAVRGCVDAVAWADTIVVQRMCSWDLVRKIVNARLDRVAIVYEIDDDLLALPSDHPLHAQAAAGKDGVQRLLRRADAVTVTTPLLAEVMRVHNPRVFVLPNYIDPTLWPPLQPRAADNDAPLTVAYAGTFTHARDLAFLLPLIGRLRAAYPGRLRFSFMGCAPAALAQADDVTFDKGGYEYPVYAQKLRAAPFDIAIAPLEDTPFNRAKSNIKYLEYARCRIPGVYARLAPYASCVRDGENGLLASADPDEWFAKIRMLIDDAALRRRIADAAYADVENDHMIGAHAAAWLAVYDDAVRFVRNGRREVT